MTISNRIHSLRAATTATAAIVLALAAIHTMTACSNDLDDIQQDMPQGVLQQGVSGEYVSVTLHLTTADLNGLAGSVSTRSATGTATVSTRPAAGEGSAQADADIVCERVPTATATVTAATATTRADGDGTTTGIDDPATAANTAIKNLWVLQYDGTDDNALLLTSAYIEDYTATTSIKLIATTTDCAIVFLANTYDNTLSFPINSTLATLKGQRFTTPGLNRVVVIDPATATTGTETFPNNGNYYQRLNGMVTTTVQTGTAITATLQHNACRITVNVTNKTAGTTYPVTLTSASVENVPGCMYMLTDYTGYTSGTAIGKPTVADIQLYPLWDADNAITWDATEATSSATKTAHLYLAPNESGVVTNNTSPKLKSLFAPSRATLLKLHGTYSDGTNNLPITYTFALGEDMTSNYQLVPNGDYVYDVTLNARGDKTTDGRVSFGGGGDVDYTDTTTWPLSNCYICNPPTTGTATFKIPVARVDQFWGGGNYENVPNNCLGDGNAWTVSVIWSDMEVKADNITITKNTGQGKGDYFEVQVPSTTEKGNVVIGIKRDENLGTWLWSWHLWVTDYCPDEAKYLTQQGAFIDGTDTYHITGGDVQRYQKASNTANQKVYMDRSIGALSADDGYSATQRGILYYQFGRKDPFPADITTYWEGGTSQTTFSINSHKTKYNEADPDAAPKNVPYSVNNPDKFIYGTTYWTYGDQYNPTSGLTSIIWQDPHASEHSNKSIFDPSPSGWKVTTSHSGLSYSAFSGGWVTASTAIIKGSVKIPAYGCRLYSSGSLSGGSSNGYYWSSPPGGVSNAYSLGFISGGLSAHDGNSNGTQRANGKPVRPVQE